MSKLTKVQRERVALALAREYGYLGVTVETAMVEVLRGWWDDHPARGRP